MCDTGSTVSFVDKTLKEQLGLSGDETILSLAGIHGHSDVVRRFQRLFVRFSES